MDKTLTSPLRKKENAMVLQFRVSLVGIEPTIWRRILVPEFYSFWDLHVAIQDAMGWLDYHLHLFTIEIDRKQLVKIGIPDDEDFDDDTQPDWEISVLEYLQLPGDTALYTYDFGDNWEHEILLEGILLREKRLKYPRCIGGERACPPEDCGSIPGYARLLDILEDPANEEYADMNSWLKGHAKNYHPFDPEAFDSMAVRFDNPDKRWDLAFSEDE